MQNYSLISFKAAEPKSSQTFNNAKQQRISTQSCGLRKGLDPQQPRTASNLNQRPPKACFDKPNAPILKGCLGRNARFDTKKARF
jgi:hypothetical protein